MGVVKTVLASYAALLLVLQPSVAHPSPAQHDMTSNLRGGLYKRAEPQDFYLRIMPLGASITAGDPAAVGDDQDNGYRKNLRDQLRFDGWQVNMVGNYNRGTMADNDHEGVPGDRVSQVDTRGKASAAVWLPNVILVNAGTNDATQNGAVEPVEGTKDRMRTMIYALFAEVPNAVIVLSTLLDNGKAQENIDLINKGYRELVQEISGDDPSPQLKVQLAEMADGFIPYDQYIYDAARPDDQTHPNMEGFERMASVWTWAIDQANEKGWLSAPSVSSTFEDGDGSTTCKKLYGSGADDPRGQTEILTASNAVIADDGTYIHAAELHEDMFPGEVPWDHPENLATDPEYQVFFAQLINQGGYPGEELDEIIVVDWNATDIKIKMNHGGGVFDDDWTSIDVQDECLIRGIKWGDVNNDGLDDFICIASNGDMFVSLNTGGNPPTFKTLGKYKTAVSGLPQANVRLGDIDGDGRLDYCVIASDGNISCWRNGGVGEMANAWEDMGSGGPVFTGKNMGDIRGVRFVDLNGDGRYDWLFLDDKGKVTTYINQRGEDKGMVPRWLSAGVTHTGMDHDIGDDRQKVQFGHVWGSGRADYIDWSSKMVVNGEGRYYELDVDVYENKGSGGKYQKGDGAYWGDVTGDGLDDYLWISPEGQVNIFRNMNSAGASQWVPWSSPTQLETGSVRRGLHIGDWNGDGRDDIIAVNDRATGSLTVWYSNWDGNEFGWDRQDIVDSAKCDQGWGIGYFDYGAHFADITGNKRVDYLCMQPNGLTTAWLNNDDGSLEDVGQVKYSQGLDRANLRFADADGDGQDDLIWTDKFTGDAKVWYNGGRLTEADRDDLHGSLFLWTETSKAVFQGSSRGPNMHFPSLQGQGRADMVQVDPTTGHGWVWYNSCPSGGDDVPDGTPIPDPELPDYTPTGGDSTPTDPADFFCNTNGGAWDTDLWVAHSMGSWLLSRTQLYSGVDSSWPSDVSGVPRTIAEYNVQEHDNAYNWGTQCISASSTCDITEDQLTNSDVCPASWERAFSLWAMRNLALFIQLFYAKVTDVFDTSALATAQITVDFVGISDSEDKMSTAGWLTVMSGIMVSASAFLPDIAPSLTFAVGLLSVASGVAGATNSDAEDPRFTSYSEMQAKMGSIKLEAQSSIETYFDRLFRNSPPNNNLDLGTELAEMLQSGLWAEQDNSEPPYSKSDMVRMIQSGIISETWNSQRLIIVKFAQGKISDVNGWSYDPCFGKTEDTLDKWSACVNGQNYIFARIPDDNAVVFADMGQDEETLEDYNLTQQLVIDGAERTQNRTGQWISRDLDDLSAFLLDLAETPPDDVVDTLIQINVPVCNLNLLGTLSYDSSDCTSPAQCMISLILKSCPMLSLSSGPFPYTPFDG